MRRDKWYNWPARRDNLLVPWYVVTRRLVGLLPFFAGMVLCYVGLVLSYGFDTANRHWKDST